ncbi:hypothetical protein AB0B30_39410 [Streptomyces narbonensis]|uniref:DUF4253 domain-containing protein n=1 Tax=Streptomyces narbonensis TaxID=67333 RepID=A0ABV3CMY9_9ACTN
MLMSRGTFDDVPLATLFPQLPPADMEAMRVVADAVDAARVKEDVPQWEWAPGHAVCPGPRPGVAVVLMADVIVHADGGDQLEFWLQVFWTDEGQIAVNAAVNVACWCETDHATHDIDELTLVVDEARSLAQAFAAGSERLVGWLVDPHDADYWRNRAALPPRWTR